GRTGSGKSAIIRLLLREFDTAQSSEIKYGSKPIRYYDISHLRAQFGYVPQDHFLFSTSIRNNIAFSNPKIDNQYIYEASRLSYIRSEEHTSELQSRFDLVCRLLLEKKNTHTQQI